MSNFEWEDRYCVLKRKDIECLTVDQQRKFWALIDEAIDMLPEPIDGPREFLVIEKDWPEYDIAAQSIEARMTQAEMQDGR